MRGKETPEGGPGAHPLGENRIRAARLGRDTWLGITLSLLGLAGLALQLTVTRWGIGLSPDSATYIAGARGLLEGHGFSFPKGGGAWAPLTLWPPLLSVFIAVPGALGADLVASARWINAILFAGNTVLAGVLVRRLSPTSAVYPVVGALLFLLMDDTLLTHSWAWAEPLFLFLGFAGLLLLDRYFVTGRRRDLMLSGFLIGLSFLTRYAGSAYVATGLLTMVLFRRRDLSGSRKLADLCLFAVSSWTLIALWGVRNLQLSGYPGGGPLIADGIDTEEWQDAYRIVSLWILPGRIGEPYRTMVMVGAGAAFLALSGAALARPSRTGSSSKMAKILLLLIPIYSAVMVWSKALVRPFPFNEVRHFLPLYLALVVLGLSNARWLYEKAWDVLSIRPATPVWSVARAGLRGAGPAVVTALLVFHAVHAGKWGRKSYVEGMGYSNESWREGTLLPYIRGLPTESAVFSNGYDAIYILTGREAYPLPEAIGSTPLERWDLRPDWAHFRHFVETSRGVIAFFREPTRRGMIDEIELTRSLDLCTALEAPEGRIYTMCGDGSEPICGVGGRAIEDRAFLPLAKARPR